VVWVVLPAYNEEENLPGLLRQLEALRGIPLRVVVVDDGSTDGTKAVVEGWSGQLHPVLVCHPRNLGLGRAIDTGLRYVLDRAGPRDVLVTLDADGSHLPAQIPDLVAAVERGADLAIASRYRPGARVEGVPLVRRFLSFGARLLLTALFPIPGVRDYTCGFRAYRAGLLRSALDRYGDRLVESQGFAVMAELLLKLRPLRPSVQEIPIVLRYDLKRGRSKLPPLRTVRQYLHMVVRLFGR
jgi:dolichol-phosphate mannosyltransferase